MTEKLNIDAPLTPGDADIVFETLLRRKLRDDAFRTHLLNSGLTLRRFLTLLRNSTELRDVVLEEAAEQDAAEPADPQFYRCPQDLLVTPLTPARIIVIGSCMMETLSNRLQRLAPEMDIELYLLGELPPEPLQPIAAYDFQIVQLALRFLVPDAAFARLGQSDHEGHAALFDHAVQTMRQLLESPLAWTRRHGLLCFVFPLLPPQQNLAGRLMPRYQLSNPVYFVEQLNKALAHEIEEIANCYLFDLNGLIGTHGARFVQEDHVAAFNHGGIMSNFDFVHDSGHRLDAAVRLTTMHEDRVQPLVRAVWAELVAMYRTIRQVDTVKLVVVDLDDTLWRGVVAEAALDELQTTEGWPKGLWEALLILKRRGVLLGIISKNEESQVREAWGPILGYQLRLEDFAALRINWEPKSANMAEILAQVNLLPRNVVFIDDHPAQRAEMAAAYPDMRVLGGNPLTWRHVLLWAAETQVPEITAESAGRTEMVQAQIEREEQRQGMDVAAFRATLELRMTVFAVGNVTHARFARVLELINKTNQFNTTGKRWTREECVAAFAEGNRFYAFDLADKHTQYGLVGVLIVDDFGILQFVMSCRVMGLDAELAAVATIANLIAACGRRMVQALVVPTERNLPCRQVYARCGFQETVGAWRRIMAEPVRVPNHVAVTVALAPEDMPGRRRQAG